MQLSFKKIISLMVALIVLLATVVVPVSGATFSDTEGHWAEKAVEKLSDYNVVNGHDRAFQPNDSVTRAEFAMMINNIMKYIETGENKFSDLNAGQWYSDAMLKLSTAGVLNGSDGKALPNGKITRQEAAVLVAKAFQIVNSDLSTPLKDEATIADWALSAVKALYSKKYCKKIRAHSFVGADFFE